jgi:Zn ribbon nucleic-acid-binding protein
MENKKLANNIDCPKCKGQNCFVTEHKDDEGDFVDVLCKDCGYHEQEMM